MKVFKYIKDSKLYIIYNMVNYYVALPYRHNGSPINNCNINEFIPFVQKEGIMSTPLTRFESWRWISIV